MAKKEFSYRGKTLNELQQMSMEEFAVLVPARERRRLKRGFTDEQKTLLRNLQRANEVKTHCREMVVIPQMVGKMIKVYNGKEFTMVQIVPEMLAHRLGEFAATRRKVAHSAPGIGATRSSASVSVK
ncbi:MAG TPA: 30S ribosomal protein S19 [Candidatus Nanoarchaeia archaeon]|nr:30S ribosomal protein S19 [Candidatus Nanoarchaeia archaeon]